MRSIVDDLKTIDPSEFAPIFEGDPSHLPNVKLRLPAGLATSTRQARRTAQHLDQPRQAAEQIGHLPEADESRHLVLHGAYPLAAFIPALRELADEPMIRELHITTLSFSAANIAMLDALVERKQIRTVSIVCSNFFAAEGLDKRIYDQGAEFARKWGFRIAAVRNHSKVMLFRFKNRRFVVESSANLRSAGNIETATIYQSRKMYDFNRAWIEELLEQGAEK